MKKTIIGAIAGDVIGSVYEFHNVRHLNFDLFTSFSTYTDDSVLTIAVADCILNEKDFTRTISDYGNNYKHRGYGGNFKNWLSFPPEKQLPYNSFGNGSAMRVSPVGFAFDTLEETLQVAKQSAEVTHNHVEGIKGAQAIASAMFLARKGKTKQEIKDYIIETFDYNLNFTLNDIRPTYGFNETCQGSVPQAIVAFLESKNYENAIRLAISIGGDSDTIACITGGIACAFYKEIPQEIINFVESTLPQEFLDIIKEFDEKYAEK